MASRRSCTCVPITAIACQQGLHKRMCTRATLHGHRPHGLTSSPGGATQLTTSGKPFFPPRPVQSRDLVSLTLQPAKSRWPPPPVLASSGLGSEVTPYPLQAPIHRNKQELGWPARARWRAPSSKRLCCWAQKHSRTAKLAGAPHARQGAAAQPHHLGC